MVSVPKRSFSLAVLLILALFAAWSHEVVAHHNHDDPHTDPLCAVCRIAGNPAEATSAGSAPTGIPVIDPFDGPAPEVAALPTAPGLASPTTRAPPIA